MATYERIDGTKVEFESLSEKEERLLRVAKMLYDTCKSEGLTVKEVEVLTKYLLNLVGKTRL